MGGKYRPKIVEGEFGLMHLQERPQFGAATAAQHARRIKTELYDAYVSSRMLQDSPAWHYWFECDVSTLAQRAKAHGIKVEKYHG
jgi:hypothetical protein